MPVGMTLANTYATVENKVTDYVGNMIYEDGVLKRILVDGGYIEDNQYHFYLADHLGNNRVVVKSDGTIIQKNHYYPFGMAFAETSITEQGKQSYKYNGKELDQMHGLNLYDYSARHYDGIRFTTIDPLAEKHYSISPYVYVLNNPLKYMDPLGMDTIGVNIDGVEVWRVEGEGDDVIFGSTNPVIVEPDQSEGSNENGTPVRAYILPYYPIDYEYPQGGRINTLGLNDPIFIIFTMGRSASLSSSRASASLFAKRIAIGQSFGKLGTVVAKFPIRITGISPHALNQAISRGVSTSVLKETIKHPSVVLQQTNGTYLFLTKEAAVVLNSSGKIVTTYPAKMFDSAIKEIINLLP